MKRSATAPKMSVVQEVQKLKKEKEREKEREKAEKARQKEEEKAEAHYGPRMNCVVERGHCMPFPTLLLLRSAHMTHGDEIARRLS
jgi:hypothetical protein